ncbi:MAG: endonuclease [Chloroflexota bacterium]
MTGQAPANHRAALLEIYGRLMARYGPQHWWPAEEPFEVMVGAILTQQAAWTNVARAISNLKAAGALSPRALRRLPELELAGLIRPAVYHNAKAKKLKALAQWLGDSYRDNLARLFKHEPQVLRRELLSVYGIGEETADSIILYAAGKPVFVVDAYTRRIMGRLGLAPSDSSYRTCQTLFMNNLPAETQMFNEYHALLVQLGKAVCRPHPLCGECCLVDVCADRGKPLNRIQGKGL